MLKDLIIRQETPADYHQTEQMVMRAFGTSIGRDARSIC